MNTAIVIPARMGSSRFPGKPLVKIHNKELLFWVIENCRNVGCAIYIATPDKEIIDAVCKNYVYGVKCITTSKEHTTGNEAVAEAATHIECDTIVNVQGDEPLVKVKWIQQVIHAKNFLWPRYEIINAMIRFDNDAEFISENTIKVVCNKNNELLYMSRCPIPYHKRQSNTYHLYKQVCIYAFNTAALIHLFNKPKSIIEYVEDICMLRPLYYGVNVKMIELEDVGNNHAVDVPADIPIVESIMIERKMV